MGQGEMKMEPFIEWKLLPRGTYTFAYDGKKADVWQFGRNIWQWNICNQGIYTHLGKESTLDNACESAIKSMDL